MEPKKTYMILHILTLAVIRTTGLSHYVEKLDELPFTTAKYFHFFSFKKTPQKIDTVSNGEIFQELDILFLVFRTQWYQKTF